MNERTTPATATFEDDKSKTTNSSTKFNRLIANCEKNSEIIKNKKEGLESAEIKGFRIKVNLLFDYTHRF